MNTAGSSKNVTEKSDQDSLIDHDYSIPLPLKRKYTDYDEYDLQEQLRKVVESYLNCYQMNDLIAIDNYRMKINEIRCLLGESYLKPEELDFLYLSISPCDTFNTSVGQQVSKCDNGRIQDKWIQLNNKGLKLYGLKSFEKAILVHTKAEQLATKIPDLEKERESMKNVSDCLIKLNRYVEAIDILKKLLIKAEDAEDNKFLRITLYYLQYIYNKITHADYKEKSKISKKAACKLSCHFQFKRIQLGNRNKGNKNIPSSNNVRAIQHEYYTKFRNDDLQLIYKIQLENSRKSDCKPLELQTYLNLGDLFFEMDNKVGAIEKYQMAINLCKELKEAQIEADIHIKLNQIYVKAEEINLAQKELKSYLSAMLRTGNKIKIANAYKSIRSQQQSKNLKIQLQNQSNRKFTRPMSEVVPEKISDNTNTENESTRDNSNDVKIISDCGFIKFDNPIKLWHMNNQRASEFEKQNDLKSALILYQNNIEIAELVSTSLGALSCYKLGMLEAKLKNYNSAITALETYLDITGIEIKDDPLLVSVLFELGKSLYSRALYYKALNPSAFTISGLNPINHDLTRALQYFLRISSIQPTGENIIKVHEYIANVYYNMRNYEAAKTHYELKLQKSVKGKRPMQELEAYFELGNCAIMLEDYKNAIYHFRYAEVKAGDLKLFRKVADAQFDLANIHYILRNYNQSLKYFESCRLFYEKNDIVDKIKQVYWTVGYLHFERQNFGSALQMFTLYQNKCFETDDFTNFEKIAEKIRSLREFIASRQHTRVNL